MSRVLILNMRGLFLIIEKVKIPDIYGGIDGVYRYIFIRDETCKSYSCRKANVIKKKMLKIGEIAIKENVSERRVRKRSARSNVAEKACAVAAPSANKEKCCHHGSARRRYRRLRSLQNRAYIGNIVFW